MQVHKSESKCFHTSFLEWCEMLRVIAGCLLSHVFLSLLSLYCSSAVLLGLCCLQAACAGQPIKVISPVEEEVKVKPTVLVQRSRDDYYNSLSDTCKASDTSMDSLKVNTDVFPSYQNPDRIQSSQTMFLIFLSKSATWG